VCRWQRPQPVVEGREPALDLGLVAEELHHLDAVDALGEQALTAAWASRISANSSAAIGARSRTSRSGGTSTADRGQTHVSKSMRSPRR
jgi:hypothetical protein